MTKYIVRDMASVFRYLPYGLLAGMLVAIILSVINDRRVRKNKTPFSVWAITCFFMYVVVLLFITFLSREDGSSKGIDLQLFSTFGINKRNNAYVVENILLFIPYGFLCAWVIPAARKMWSCTLIGAMTSLGIECMQMITGRGIFQIDDVLTNTIGAILGYLLYRCVTNKTQRVICILAVIAILAAMLYLKASTVSSPLDFFG